jgi:hypothetical protein
MASLIQWLKFTGARNVDGTPIATGTIEFFVPGSTSTRVLAYSDSSAQTTLTQPITLDAAGRAEVFVAAKAQYLIKDYTGAVIHGVDTDSLNVENSVTSPQVDITSAYWSGVNGGGETLGYPTELTEIANKLGETLGNDGLYQEQVVATCRPRTYLDLLHNVVRAKDYGALGNGTNDDTLNLQRAINRAIATNLPLHLESGTYRTTYPLTISGSIYIFGDGQNASVVSAESSVNGIEIDAGSGTVRLRDFTVVTVMESNGPVAITVAAAGYMEASNVNVQGRIGFDAHLVDKSKFINCIASSVSSTAGNPAYGFYLGNNATLIGCEVICFDALFTESTGISVGARSNAIGCKVNDMVTGFEARGVYSLIIASIIDGCVIAASALFAGSGAAFCFGTSGGGGVLSNTTEFAVNFANILGSDQGSTDSAGAWYSDRSPANVYRGATQIGAGFTVTPTVDGDRHNAFNATAAGTVAITVAAPVGPTGAAITPRTGTRMAIILQCASGSVVSPTWNAIYIGGNTTNVASGTYRVQYFSYVGTHWVAENSGENITGAGWV